MRLDKNITKKQGGEGDETKFGLDHFIPRRNSRYGTSLDWFSPSLSPSPCHLSINPHPHPKPPPPPSLSPSVTIVSERVRSRAQVKRPTAFHHARILERSTRQHLQPFSETPTWTVLPKLCSCRIPSADESRSQAALSYFPSPTTLFPDPLLHHFPHAFSQFM